MKWYGLYKKIGKQELGKVKKWDVIAFINGKDVPLLVKFKADGSPYLIPKDDK